MFETIGAVLRRVLRWGPDSSRPAAPDVAALMGREPVAAPPAGKARRVECDRATCREEATHFIRYREANGAPAAPGALPSGATLALVCETHYRSALRVLELPGAFVVLEHGTAPAAPWGA